MQMQLIAYIIVPLIISTLLTPIVKWIALKLDIYAHINDRTVHTGKIARIGGVAIYVSFILSISYFTSGIDTAMQGMILGSSIIFFAGLIDDMVDLKPIIKLIFEIIAAYVLIVVGKVELDTIHLPFLVQIDMGVISFLVTFIWVIGITNAINLVDGLDGLAGGISSIVLISIAIISFAENRMDITMIALIVAGATIGFLFFNFHPAKIFMGDCGALFLGFIVASLSLMGFKGSTFITLGFPILLLSVPIIDTLSAMVRRFLGGKKFSDADKGHLHHVLMRRFGHRNTVFIIYAITIAFGISANVYIMNKNLGLVCVAVLFIGLELFIEKTQMISCNYHPLMTMWRLITKQKEKKDDEC